MMTHSDKYSGPGTPYVNAPPISYRKPFPFLMAEMAESISCDTAFVRVPAH
jgi:hypothetical protein